MVFKLIQHIDSILRGRMGLILCCVLTLHPTYIIEGNITLNSRQAENHYGNDERKHLKTAQDQESSPLISCLIR